MHLENYFKNGKVYVWKENFYSTDHILVKDKDLVKAEEKLKDLGCIVEEK